VARYGQAFKDKAAVRLLPPATAAMDEAGKNAWCWENGVYPQELEPAPRARPCAHRRFSPSCNHQQVAFRRALRDKIGREIQPVFLAHDTALFPCLLAGVIPRQESVLDYRLIVLVSKVEEFRREPLLTQLTQN